MGPHRVRWMIGITITAFWILMTGLLLQRELGFEHLAGSIADLSTETETWMGLFAGDERVGVIRLNRQPMARPGGKEGLQTDLNLRLELNLLGKRTHVALSGFTWQATAERRVEFGFNVRSGESDLVVRGEVAGGELVGEVFTAGETLPLRFPVDDDVLFTSGSFGGALALPRLEPGQRAQITGFDPLTLQPSPVRLRAIGEDRLTIAGEEIPVQVLEVETSGFRSHAWVAAGGEVVRADTPLGLRLVKISAQEALAAGSPREAADVLGLSAVHPTGPRPFRGARTLVVDLSGLADDAKPEALRLGNGRHALAQALPPATGTTPAPAAELAPALAADAFVQSDSPKIQEQAAAVVGNEADPWQRALALHDWVFEQLAKEPVLSVPSALEVLATRRGDCNEHTVLFTALARAAGIPTRIAIGLVWSDDLEGFFYHAWPEVHVGGWIAMDPTLGQPLADATHLKLFTGGIESWPQLLPYLGRLQITVVEVA